VLMTAVAAERTRMWADLQALKTETQDEFARLMDELREAQAELRERRMRALSLAGAGGARP